ncbi:MAG: IS5/IS1182 family transposase, partial [Victivallaceae bacterium]|nr:IS5/IS1182 family transposase [Victivallaceae bacterium]
MVPDAIIEQLTIIQAVHDQQRTMPDARSRRIDNRIVSFNQPHVRPIVRGKAGHETEFGAKLT